MGYTIKIGNAVISGTKENFPELYASWNVQDVMLSEAPNFPNDVNNNRNERWPSYSVWDDFCKKTGLYKFFYGKYKRVGDKEIEFDGIFTESGHPGCIGITNEHLEIVSDALLRYRKTSSLLPGFETHEYNGEANYDYHLARLIWLEWWMRWSIKNCETPAIENS